MAKAITAADDSGRRAQTGQDEQAEAAWRQWALNAEDALKARLRGDRHPAAAHRRPHGTGQRPASRIHPHAAQLIEAENTTLKQRVLQLADEKRTLEEKLQDTRSDNRFLDKCVAGLESAADQCHVASAVSIKYFRGEYAGLVP